MNEIKLYEIENEIELPDRSRNGSMARLAEKMIDATNRKERNSENISTVVANYFEAQNVAAILRDKGFKTKTQTLNGGAVRVWAIKVLATIKGEK